MSLDDYLKNRYEKLQQEYDDLSDEIGYLRESQKTENLLPKEAYRLKKQI